MKVPTFARPLEAAVTFAQAKAELAAEMVRVAREGGRAVLQYLDEILTPAEVATWLRVEVDSVYRWASDGTGPRRVKLGGLDNGPLRFLRGDVLAWLEERAIEPAKPAPRARRRSGRVVIQIAHPQIAAEVAS